MKKSVEKKLLLNSLYLQYILRLIKAENEHYVDNGSMIYKIRRKELVKVGTCVVLNSYILQLSLLNKKNIHTTISEKKLLTSINSQLVKQFNHRKMAKFCSLLVFKALLGGYLCLVQGVFRFCRNPYKNERFLKNKSMRIKSLINFSYNRALRTPFVNFLRKYMFIDLSEEPKVKTRLQENFIIKLNTFLVDNSDKTRKYALVLGSATVEQEDEVLIHLKKNVKIKRK